MATLLLQTAGSAIGGAIGGPFGAMLGKTLGSIGGALIDNALFGSGKGTEGPKLTTLAGLTSTEGAVIPRVYGRVRIGGQIIWATRFEEQANAERNGATGAKGMGKKAGNTSFTYFANIAVGLCEGPIAQVRRIWADGKEIDRTLFTIRVHRGEENQDPDPLIVAKEGADHAPAYRGLAYVVFERMALADYGNRVPQLSFEVVRPVEGLASLIRGVDLIPGATEFGYSVGALTTTTQPGVSTSENRHQLVAASDWTASLDALQALCPNLTSVALVVSWFGDDLRAGQCTISPRVEKPIKQVTNASWSVSGVTRERARVVSQVDGGPAIGGTPSDSTVMDAIRDLKARGLSVVFYPFVMMDVPRENGRTDPWTGGANQPAFPWRGRITCDPAPGRAGTPDGTRAAATQVESFFGPAAGGDTSWSYRRFILHCANLCASAGGVDAFLVGSELAALTRVRSAPGVYPAANALAVLAGDVKGVLGPGTKVSYSADWTEYGAHVLSGGAEVGFPLDVVWSSPSVDFVGIDAYFPLSDWRDGSSHADAAIARSVYDLDYLRARIASGEGYDWYYLDDAAREAQVRTPITDGAYGKPWVYRVKDLRGWWSNAHVERVGGLERTSSTGWVPASKPIWFIEIGCPAVDRGANAPNVFADPKSSESALPPFSRGFRDDLMQARALEAMITRFEPAIGGEDANPMSPLYGGRMVDTSRIHVWAWDARPFPAFPQQGELWTDAPNWETGHWLNGRLEGVALDRLVATLAGEAVQAASMERPAIDGFLDGYALDRIISPRAAIEPLCAIYGFDAVISAGQVRFLSRARRQAIDLQEDDLVPLHEGALVALTRAQESELPYELALTFTDGARDYRSTSVSSRRVEGWSKRQQATETAIVTEQAEARRRADIWLQDLWVARETAGFRLRPGLVSLDVGDCVTLQVEGSRRLYRVTRITDGLYREALAQAVDPALYDAPPPFVLPPVVAGPQLPGPPHPVTLDLAIARDDSTTLQHLAVFADPWPGAMALYRSNGGGFDFARAVTRCAIVGETVDALAPGRPGIIDRNTRLRVQVRGGALTSVSEGQMLSGANVAAIENDEGAWEIISFANAELIGADLYRLSVLVRGLGGEEGLCARSLLAGATFVLLDDAVVPLATGLAELRAPATWRVGPADRDHADPAFVEFSGTPGAKALMPYAPVHPRAQRSSDGVLFTFVRRSRRDADAWEPIDPPIGEEIESYEIDILKSGVVVRTLSGPTTALLYPTTHEAADFGGMQTSFDVQIFQMSAVVGRGFPLVAHVAP